MEFSTLTCLHCGLPLSHQKKIYCCKGCEQVAALLKELPNQSQKFEKKLIGKSENRYFYLNQPEFQELYRFQFQNQSPEISQYRIYIEGIYCSSCIQLLESLPRIVSGVQACELQFGESLLTLECSKNCALSEVAETIEKMGYRPHFLIPGQSQLDRQKTENRTDLMRIGVAASVTANIMLLAISVYSGLQGELAIWFHHIEGLLFLPLLLYSSLPFYQGALRSLRFGKISIDLPITIALLLSACFSYRSLFVESDQVYFDSTASFITLILASRFVLKRIQQKNSNLTQTLHLFNQQGAWVLQKGEKIFKPLSLLKKDDLLLIHSGERIPIDGVLESPHASVDFSLMTGESTPKSLQQGMEILAGAKCYSDQIQIRATKPYHESKLSLMMQNLAKSTSQKTPFIHKTDRAAQYLISFVLLVAVVFFVFYSKIDFEDAISRSLALIVLACPCALALGTPLALSQGLKHALQNGIMIKKPEALEKAMSTRALAFDKTGTLTYGELSLKECPLLSDELKKIILTLESVSHHPIAEAFRKTWTPLSTLSAQDLKETPGVGVSGLIKNHLYELKRSQEFSLNEKSHIGPQVSLFQNGKKLFDFYFQDQPRREAKTLISFLKKWKFQTFLISGDHTKSVEIIAKHLGFQNGEYFSEMLPEDKKRWIQNHQHVAMIGDGTNDTLGMAHSSFSISVKKSASEALEVSDIYIAEQNISKILDLFIIANETKTVISRNIAFALGYNVSTGIAALFGWIGPMGAALFMPISSFVILANSYYGTRRLRRLNQKLQNQNCPIPLPQKGEALT